MFRTKVFNSNRRFRRTKGFTLVEMVLAIAVIGLAAVGLFVLYNNTVRPSLWINDKVQAFSGLMSALEQARTINGGGYPLQATALNDLGNIAGNTPTESILRSVLGATNTNYKNWTYTCTAAGVLTIGVYVGEETNVDRQLAVKRSVEQNFSPFTCNDPSSGIITCSKSNVLCK